jgi:ankyrin repeat protein
MVVGKVALMSAARKGDIETVKRLVSSGVRLNEFNKENMTALMIAIQEHHNEVVKCLIDSGADIDAQSRTADPLYHGLTALIVAVLVDNHEARELLRHASKDKWSVMHRYTALMRAVYMDNLRVVDWLLSNGASVHIENSYGRTALYYAITGKMVRRLLDAGANKDHADNEGRTALMDVEWKNEVFYPLLEAGANIDAQDKMGNTALIWAAEVGRLDKVCMLLRAGAKLDIRNKAGQTAICHARNRGHMQVVDQLSAKPSSSCKRKRQ